MKSSSFIDPSFIIFMATSVVFHLPAITRCVRQVDDTQGENPYYVILWDINDLITSWPYDLMTLWPHDLMTLWPRVSWPKPITKCYLCTRLIAGEEDKDNHTHSKLATPPVLSILTPNWPLPQFSPYLPQTGHSPVLFQALGPACQSPIPHLIDTHTAHNVPWLCTQTAYQRLVQASNL